MNHQLQRAEPGATTAGSEPLQWLFRHTAAHWGTSRPLATAGKVCRWPWMAWSGAPRTQDNRQHFGLPAQPRRPSKSLPLVRMACLLDARARLLVDASLDAYDTSEYAWLNACGRSLPPDSLVIVDKGFYSASLLWPLQHRQGRHWLIPARAGLRGEVVQTHGPGDV